MSGLLFPSKQLCQAVGQQESSAVNSSSRCPGCAATPALDTVGHGAALAGGAGDACTDTSLWQAQPQCGCWAKGPAAVGWAQAPPGEGHSLAHCPQFCPSLWYWALLYALVRDDLFVPWYVQQYLPHSSFIREQEEDINVTKTDLGFIATLSLSLRLKSLFLSPTNSRETSLPMSTPSRQLMSKHFLILLCIYLSSTTAKASTKPDVPHEWPQAEPLQCCWDPVHPELGEGGKALARLGPSALKSRVGKSWRGFADAGLAPPPSQLLQLSQGS